MKRLAVALSLLATPALAQQAPPTMAQIQAQLDHTVVQVNGIVMGLANQIAVDQAQIAKLQSEFDAAKKPADAPK